MIYSVSYLLGPAVVRTSGIISCGTLCVDYVTGSLLCTILRSMTRSSWTNDRHMDGFQPRPPTGCMPCRWPQEYVVCIMQYVQKTADRHLGY